MWRRGYEVREGRRVGRIHEGKSAMMVVAGKMKLLMPGQILAGKAADRIPDSFRQDCFPMRNRERPDPRDAIIGHELQLGSGDLGVINAFEADSFSFFHESVII